MRNLVSLPLEIEQIKIYNRWGNEVYKSDKIWDGNIDGKNAPAEVYYYTMTYFIGKSCYHTAKGNVTLMR
jgi:gliding motility-associated-like protein